MATAGLLERLLKIHCASNASGIDGAPQMIANAKARGGSEEYILANIDDYEPTKSMTLFIPWKFCIILEDPLMILNKIANSWLAEKGG